MLLLLYTYVLYSSIIVDGVGAVYCYHKEVRAGLLFVMCPQPNVFFGRAIWHVCCLVTSHIMRTIFLWAGYEEGQPFTPQR